MASRARSRSLTPQAGPYTRPGAASSHPVRSHPPNSKLKSKLKAVPKPPSETVKPKPVEPKPVEPTTVKPKSTKPNRPPRSDPTPRGPSPTNGASTTKAPPKLTPAQRRIAATQRRTPPPEHLFIAPRTAPPFHFSMVPPLRVPKSNAMWARDGKVDTEVYLAEVEREGRDDVEGEDRSGRRRDTGQQGPKDTEVIVIDSDSDEDKPTPKTSAPSGRHESHVGNDSEPFRYPSFSPNPSWTPAQTRVLWAAMIEVGEKNKNWALIAARVSAVGSAKSNSECRKKWEREKKKAFP